MHEQQGPQQGITIAIHAGPHKGQQVTFTKTNVIIGRDPGNDMVINDPAVSRRHIKLSYDEVTRHWQVEKLTPQNTVSINGHEVYKAVVAHQDVIKLGISTILTILLPMPVTVQQAEHVLTVPAREERGVQQEAALVSSPSGQPTPARGTQVALPLDLKSDGIPFIEIRSEDHQQVRMVKLMQAVTSLGRDAKNDIVINDPIVSSFHAQIVREEEDFILIHPHPSRTQTVNGLMYAGSKIAGQQAFRKSLKRGDIIRIGDQKGTLITLTFHDGTGAAQEAVPPLQPIPLIQETVTIGRLPDNTVVLDHPQISAHHARLQRSANTYRLIDQGSTNHVYVNTKKVKEHLLTPGDEIRIGPFKLTFTGNQLTQQDESKSISIDAINVRKTGNKNTILLHDISLVIPPRTFVALVGGSGAGKSTFMDALNGLRPAQQGTILYNGQDYYQHIATFRSQLGYVPQDDIVHRDLSVERVLYYAAKLRLPADFTKAQIKQRVEEVLEDVEITHRRHLLVSKLSGGQRKRVSIALELLAKPSVFFLDEPTSGLDPGLDRKMMHLLRRLADRGHTIVLVTHATNNINVCDFVCFLAQGGRLAYYGPPDTARTFFGKASFAEIYSALEPTEEEPDIPAQAEAHFKASVEYQRYIQEPLKRQQGANLHDQPTVQVKMPHADRRRLWQQFLLLSMRYIELLKNDRGNLLILLLQAPVIGLILMFLADPNTFATTHIVTCPTRANIQDTSGPIVSLDCQRVLTALKSPQGQVFVRQQNQSTEEVLQRFIAPSSGIIAQQILFIMAFSAVMFGCINAAREIVKEGPIYRRERSVNLGILPYMFSKFVVLGILCLLQSAILVLMVNARMPFGHSTFLPAPVEIYITLALTSLAGLMLGLAVSTLAPNTDRSMSLVPILLIPQVIFSGMLFTINTPGMAILASFFPTRWAMASLGSSIGLHADKLGVDDFAYCGTLFSACSREAAISHLLLLWLALCVLIVALGSIVGLFLKQKDKRR